MTLIESIQTVQGSPPEKPNRPSGDSRQVQTRKGQNLERNSTVQNEKHDATRSNKAELESSKETSKIEKTIEKTTEDLQKFVDSIGRELAFEVHKEDGEVVIKVFRKSDGELVRQIPPENVVKLAESDKGTSGLLLEELA